MAQSIRGIIYLTVTRESRVNRDYVNYYFVFLSRDSVEKLGSQNSFLQNCVRNRSTGSRRYAHLETTLRGVLDRIFNRGFYVIPPLSLSPDLPINRKWPFYDSLVCYWNAIPSVVSSTYLYHFMHVVLF